MRDTLLQTTCSAQPLCSCDISHSPSSECYLQLRTWRTQQEHATTHAGKFSEKHTRQSIAFPDISKHLTRALARVFQPFRGRSGAIKEPREDDNGACPRACYG